MNYQEMSDEQIEFAVSDVLNIPRGDKWCSDWAETGQIIEKYKISVIHDCMAEPQDGGCWLARPTYAYEHVKARSDNPLRAAMAVFLMMKGGE